MRFVGIGVFIVLAVVLIAGMVGLALKGTNAQRQALKNRRSALRARYHELRSTVWSYEPVGNVARIALSGAMSVLAEEAEPRLEQLKSEADLDAFEGLLNSAQKQLEEARKNDPSN